MALLLFLGTELQQDRRARHERRDLEDAGELVADDLLVERALVRGREALAAVLRREADAGEARFVVLLLEVARLRDQGELLFFGLAGAVVASQRWALFDVRGEPCARTLAKRFNTLHVGGTHRRASLGGGHAACASRKLVIRCR
jgi:hypothetical protein